MAQPYHLGNSCRLRGPDSLLSQDVVIYRQEYESIYAKPNDINKKELAELGAYRPHP